jgi:ABC-type oligopeptide transport system substrate-binding subunit
VSRWLSTQSTGRGLFLTIRLASSVIGKSVKTPPPSTSIGALPLRRLRVTSDLSSASSIGPCEYPAPSSYVPQFFGCSGGLSNGYVCDRSLDRRMRHASSLELRTPADAAAAWAKIDRYIVRRAYWVPTVNPQEAELVSKRLANYQYNPVWGFIADQAWLR